MSDLTPASPASSAPSTSFPYRIESLTPARDRAAFACGEPSVDRWFRETAGQATRRGYAAVHLLVDNATDTIAGFSSLSNFTVMATNLPPALGKSLPRAVALPAHLIGQLGVDTRFQGQRLGNLLVLNALRRAHRLTQDAASVAVIVHAVDAERAQWYARFGFVPFPAHPLHLVLPMREIAALASASLAEPTDEPA